MKTIGRLGVAAFENRCIDLETASRFGIYTGRTLYRENEQGEREFDKVVPDPRGNVIVFPYMEHGTVVAEHYRGPNKFFFQRPGGRKTFWNADVLDDPALAQEGGPPLIIFEGEIDGLTGIDCGFPHSVSVPDGAPAVPKGKSPDDLDPLDPDTEATGKFEYIWNNRDRLRRIRRFVLAVDNDAPGMRLRAELLRRLSPARCSFVEYPDGCKDINDVRVKLGPEAVTRVLNSAKAYPLSGIYRLSDYPEMPVLETYTTGLLTLDEHFKPFLGELAVLIGIPGHGKSALIENWCVHWARRYGWRTAFFTPEQPAVPQMRDRLRACYLRRDLQAVAMRDIGAADDWIDDNFLFIGQPPQSHEDSDTHLEWVLDRAIDCVMRDGIKVLVLDPWNEIEQLRKRGESATEYTGRALRMINQFRRAYGVMVCLAVHPTKEVGKDGKARPPTPYDTDGSAHFYNKADHFFTVHRPDKATSEAMIRVSKVKFRGTGSEGQITVKFDEGAHCYTLLDASSAAQEDMTWNR